MRLVCPNCEAKYEVPDDAIPDTGRDVHCTNCGHTWFHVHVHGRISASPLGAPVPAAPAAEVQELAAEPGPEPVPGPDAKVVADGAADDRPGVVDDAETLMVDAVLGRIADAVAESGPQAETAVAEAVTMEFVERPVEADAVVTPHSEPSVGTSPDAERVAGVEILPANETEPVVEVEASAAGIGQAGPFVDSFADSAAVAEVAAETRVAEIVDEVTVDMVTADVIADDDAQVPAEASTVATVAENPAPAPDYAVNDSVLAILREEAQHEANARRAEALESQTDLGLDTAMPGKTLVRAEAQPSARRDLLPDVEEINSTLRPSEMQADADGAPDFLEPPPEAPRGFRSGFLSLMMIAGLAAALYLVAPRLAVMVPAVSGPLATYVSLIDSLRLGLDGIMRSATVAISDG